MKKALAGVAAALAIGLWAAPAAATHVFVVGGAGPTVDVVNDCTGEIERFSGLLEQQIKSGSGGLHGFGTMFGSEEPKFIGQFTVQQSAGDGTQETLVTTAVLTDESGRRLILHAVTHVTVGADGVVATVDEAWTTCIA